MQPKQRRVGAALSSGTFAWVHEHIKPGTSGQCVFLQSNQERRCGSGSRIPKKKTEMDISGMEMEQQGMPLIIEQITKKSRLSKLHDLVSQIEIKNTLP